MRWSSGTPDVVEAAPAVGGTSVVPATAVAVAGGDVGPGVVDSTALRDRRNDLVTLGDTELLGRKGDEGVDLTGVEEHAPVLAHVDVDAVLLDLTHRSVVLGAQDLLFAEHRCVHSIPLTEHQTKLSGLCSAVNCIVCFLFCREARLINDAERQRIFNFCSLWYKNITEMQPVTL